LICNGEFGDEFAFGGVFDNWAGEIVEHLGVGEEFFDCAKDCRESDGDRAIDLKTNFFFTV